MKTKSTTRTSPGIISRLIETITVMSLEDAVNSAVQTFGGEDVVVSLGSKFCLLADLTDFLKTLPAHKASQRRYVTACANINHTGEVVSHYASVDMIAPRLRTTHYSQAELVRNEMVFVFAIQSREFLNTTSDWLKFPRVPL